MNSSSRPSRRLGGLSALSLATAVEYSPCNFFAMRLSTSYLHPRVLGSTSNLPAQMALTFMVSLLGIALLYATLCSCELTAKRTRAQLRALRRLADARAGIGED